MMSFFAIKFGLLRDLPVWSSLPITWGKNGTEKASEPLDLNRLYSMDEEMVGKEKGHGFICWDEVQFGQDAYAATSKAARLLSYILIQLRKRRLSFIYTTQVLRFVNTRLRLETDIEFRCRDAFFTDSGREQHLERGEKIVVSAKDVSGLSTGYRFDELPKWHQFIFKCKGIWGSYDTDHLDDIFDLMRPVQMDLDKRIIYADGQEHKEGVVEETIRTGLSDLIQAGTMILPADELWTHLASYGLTQDHLTLGRVLKALGARRTGNAGRKYDLSDCAASV